LPGRWSSGLCVKRVQSHFLNAQSSGEKEPRAMKVVCEGCNAKYQVPDARVAGKKLKIRCKRCGETVLIRGDLQAASGDDGATTVAPSTLGSGQGDWHVSVDGQVSGPFAM